MKLVPYGHNFVMSIHDWKHVYHGNFQAVQYVMATLTGWQPSTTTSLRFDKAGNLGIPRSGGWDVIAIDSSPSDETRACYIAAFEWEPGYLVVQFFNGSTDLKLSKELGPLFEKLLEEFKYRMKAVGAFLQEETPGQFEPEYPKESANVGLTEGDLLISEVGKIDEKEASEPMTGAISTTCAAINVVEQHADSGSLSHRGRQSQWSQEERDEVVSKWLRKPQSDARTLPVFLVDVLGEKNPDDHGSFEPNPAISLSQFYAWRRKYLERKGKSKRKK